jgi:cyanophycinase
MAGPVALVGAGEFLPAMAPIDRDLLAAAGRRRPRVVVLPTASWPDGEAVFQRWAARGVEHFRALGAEVEPALVRDRAGSSDPATIQAIGEADLVYLSGGRPGHLRDALDGTALGAAIRAAHDRGATLVGCSAGAMVLAEHLPTFRLRRLRLPWPARWERAMAVVPGVAVLPHYDRWPEPLCALLALQAPRGATVLGVDEGTVLVGRDGTWTVAGRARVTVWRGRRRERYRAGEAIGLLAGPQPLSMKKGRCQDPA